MSDKFEDLKGKTLIKVEQLKENREDELIFITNKNEIYKLHHEQDCCESVTIEDICGDLDDLIGTPILLAEEVSHKDSTPEGIKQPEYEDSFTWTFYKLSTIKGSVTIRWYGASNGYYSESVNFVRVYVCKRCSEQYIKYDDRFIFKGDCHCPDCTVHLKGL